MANNKRAAGYIGGSPKSLTGPGTMFTLGFIALAIGFGILFSRGVTPKSMLSDVDPTEEYEIIPITPDPSQKGLQLKTIKFKACSSAVTIDLLLDRSGSMAFSTPEGVTKMSRLQAAVNSLVEKANDNSIIGIQSFNSDGPANVLVNNITSDVEISFYKDVKAIIPAKVASLTPVGATPTHDALMFSYEKLKTAVADPRFKDRDFNFVLVTDGAPCPGFGCGTPGKDQDPRKYDPNPADLIKSLGVNIYTVGIYSPQDGDPTQLVRLLRDNIASKPENYFASAGGDDVGVLLKQISNRICSQEAAAN